MFDELTDAAHIKQMSLGIRYVEMKGNVSIYTYIAAALKRIL